MLQVVHPDGHHTKYERARLIGARALQISQGAPLLIAFTPEEFATMKFNPIEIAKREFEAGILPLAIKRT